MSQQRSNEQTNVGLGVFSFSSCGCGVCDAVDTTTVRRWTHGTRRCLLDRFWQYDLTLFIMSARMSSTSTNHDIQLGWAEQKGIQV